MVFGFNIDDVLRNTSERVWTFYKREYPNSTLNVEDINISDLQKSLELNSEDFQEFIENYILEIYGTAADQYKNSNIDFNNFVNFLADNGHQTAIFQQERSKIKNATLYFISDRCLNIDSINFINNSEEIWDKCDVFICANPKFLKMKTGKELIKVNKIYNTEIVTNNSIDQIKDLFNLINFGKNE